MASQYPNDDQSINDKTVAEFKSDVITACPSLVTLKDQYVVRSIPNSVFERLFREVFEGDLFLARDVLFGRIERLRNSQADKVVEAIATMERASSLIQKSLTEKQPMLLISDTDNDGSISQAIAMEARRLFDVPFKVLPKDYNPENHGFSIQQIKDWLSGSGIRENEPFTVIIVDLGTNQRQEQDLFLSSFPKATLIIADHHQPELDMMVSQDAGRSILVSPYVKGSVDLALRAGGGVSGGYLLYTLFKLSAIQMQEVSTLPYSQQELKKLLLPMQELGRAANLLDMVKCDIRLKPLHEKDLEKAFNIASLTSSGRSLSRWMSDDQVHNLQALTPIVGAEEVKSYLEIRELMIEQNHIAHALYRSLPLIFEPKDDDKPLLEEVTLFAAQNSPQESVIENYVEKLRPYVFNFSYENRFKGEQKTEWLELSSKCLKDLGKLEQKIRVLLRQHNLVRQISKDHVIVTQAAGPEVEKAFSPRQLDQAYQSTDKTVKFSLVATRGNSVILSSRSSLSMHEMIFDAEETFPLADLVYRGHGGAGALTVISKSEFKHGSFQSLLDHLVSHLNDKAKLMLSQRNVDNVIEVESIHLPLIKEIFEKTRANLTPAASPEFLFRLKPDTTFKDAYTLQKRTVMEIVADNEWITTVEPLSFDGKKKLILPNQALKTLANDNFQGALALKLLPNGAFSANKVYTGSQLENKKIPKMILPAERERKALLDYYKQNFQGRDFPVLSISREQAIEALHFAANSEKVFANFEAIVIGLIDKLRLDHYVIKDVEADEAGDAECINYGACITSKDPESGVIINEEDFNKMILSSPDSVDNYRYLDDNKVIINERIKTLLLSQVIGSDAGKPAQPSIKVQNLTNLTPEFLKEVGTSSEEAQRNILNVYNTLGKIAVQAHNLPYDNNITRVNFPELYELTSRSIHIDSAIPSKEKQIAYTGIKVNTIDGVEFYNAEHPGYNLSTLLADTNKVSFSFPAIKGGHILNVNGSEVSIFNLSTRVSSKLELSREDLIPTLLPNLKLMQHPKYGIEKLLRMATIRDLIDHQPVKETVYVPFEEIEGMSIRPELWAHFQTHYAFDRSVDENIVLFFLIPEVQKELLDETIPGGGFDAFKTFKMDAKDAPKALTDARSAGNKNFEPNAKFETKTAAEEHKSSLNTFSSKDVFKMNIYTFLEKNQQNAERYANSWLYELVLDHHETTEKNPSASFISGVSEFTGVDPAMIKTIYDEAYRYRKFRGIQSYRVHETHNNIGLEGDAFQEAVAFIHMLNLKVRNPYLVGEIALRNRMNPNSTVIDALAHQAAESTLKQMIRSTTKVALDEDRFNTYSSKQMEQFSDDGISAKNNRGNRAMMRCKTLSESKAEVMIELPEYDPEKYRSMSKEDRMLWEQKIENAVTLLVLSNSRKSAEGDIKTIVENLVTSPENLNLFKEIREHFGPAFATRREGQLKAMLSAFSEAILGHEELKLPSNREVPFEDLELCKEVMAKIIIDLEETQGFVSAISIEAIEDAILVAKGQYLANQEAINHLITKNEVLKVHSVPGYPELDKGAKQAQTRFLNSLANVLEEHSKVFPELANTVVATKTKILDFLTKSPIFRQVIQKNEIGALGEDIDRSLKLK